LRAFFNKRQQTQHVKIFISFELIFQNKQKEKKKQQKKHPFEVLLCNSLQADQAPGRHRGENSPFCFFSLAFIALGCAGLCGQVGVGASCSHLYTSQVMSAIP